VQVEGRLAPARPVIGPTLAAVGDLMNRIILCIIAGTLMPIALGCSTSADMLTRTYKLPQGDASWAAITMVLEDEWQQNSVMSRAERREDGVAVRTTPRGHRNIEEVLAAK
jgi:hypothetical protein